ncbi:MAG: DUF3829 domain-containing protein [Daejeonella sp.]
MKKVFLFQIFALIIFSTACTRNGGQVAENAEQTALNNKTNQFIYALNSQSLPIKNNYDTYLSWVDTAKGPTGNESNIRGLGKIPKDTEKCIADLKKASQLKPKLEKLDKAGSAYITELEKLYPLLEKAGNYYGMENYKNDQMALGKEFHTEFLTHFKLFLAASNVLRKETDILEDEKNQQQLISLKGLSAKKNDYCRLVLLISAKKIVKMANVNDLRKLNFDQFLTELNFFEKNLDEFQKNIYATKYEQTTDFSALITSAKEYLKEGKDIMTKARFSKAFTEDELKQLKQGDKYSLDGKSQGIVGKYNSLITIAEMTFKNKPYILREESAK